MAHHRIKDSILIAAIGLVFSACAAKQELSTRTPVPKTVLESSLPARKVFEISENYLEYHLGYALRVRDLERGLIVSDWAAENPAERQQITLRVSANHPGSLVSAHVKTEAFTDEGWRDIPTSGDREAKFLADLQTYLNQKH